MKTSIKKIIVGTFVAGTLTIAGASSAFAAGETPSPRPGKAQLCERAQGALERLTALVSRLENAKAKLTDALATAQAQGNAEAVARIEARLEKVNAAIERATNRISQLSAKVAEKCQPAV